MAFTGYCQNFYQHLRNNEDDRGDFMELYDYWIDMRNDTISTGKRLGKSCDSLEKSTTIINGISKACGVGAGLTYLSYGIGLVNPVVGAAAKVVGVVSHGVSAGISAVDLAVTNQYREEASSVLTNDCEETSSLFNMGLRYRRFQDDVRAAANSFQRMTISGSLRGTALHDIFNSLRNVEHRGVNFPRQIGEQMALVPVYMRQTLDMRDVTQTLQTVVQNNPQLRDVTYNAGEALCDLFGYYAMGTEGTGRFTMREAGQLLNVVELYKDVVDLCVCFRKLQRGCTSVTGKKISSIVKVLEEEKAFIVRVHDKLLQD